MLQKIKLSILITAASYMYFYRGLVDYKVCVCLCVCGERVHRYWEAEIAREKYAMMGSYFFQ